ncbi:uracil-DNA glycosylase family protein [Acidicapsa dinghuensis]|uniref:Uracil-DNA glycosylase family protein n=2 Tax=Acidicapsa dinghuensis TaxID=2218256 RepID=A0ABW1EIS1_9BACT
MKEIHACRPWLDAELEVARPKLLICLGATAAQSILGSKSRITESHGRLQVVRGLPPVVATLHTSAVLHSRNGEDRKRNTYSLIQGDRIQRAGDAA